VSCRLAVLGLALTLTGCTGASTAPERPSQGGATGRPTLPPAATPSPQPSAATARTVFPSPPSIAIESPGHRGVVAYPVCVPNEAFHCRVWVVNEDGASAHELLPDVPGSQWPLGWSADGSRLSYYFAWGGLSPNDGTSGIAVTDAAGSAPRVLFDAGNPTNGSPGLCPERSVNCGRSEDMSVISPDGTRLAYVVAEGVDSEISSIVVLDVDSGQVMRLRSTRTRNPPSGRTRAPTSPAPRITGGTTAHRSGRRTGQRWSSRASAATAPSSPSTPTTPVFESSPNLVASGTAAFDRAGRPTARASSSVPRPSPSTGRVSPTSRPRQMMSTLFVRTAPASRPLRAMASRRCLPGRGTDGSCSFAWPPLTGRAAISGSWMRRAATRRSFRPRSRP
jgi:hypothetical protein